MSDSAWVVAQLRHLYRQMLDGNVINTAAAARGLLGPVIEELESEAPDREWREAFIAPFFGEDCTAEGAPDVILTFSVEHGLQMARIRWPMAKAWKFIAFTDPNNPEKILPDTPQAIQRLAPIEHLSPEYKSQ